MRLLEQAGCFGIVLEKIPSELARAVAESVSSIIGAGPHCDGQVVFLHDLLGITTDFSPSFYADILTLKTR